MVTHATGKIIPYKQRLSDRIRASMIVGKLQKHIEDPIKNPLLISQLTAARILLNKVIPDVQSLKIQEVRSDNIQTITNDTLRSIINGESKRVDNDAQ